MAESRRVSELLGTDAEAPALKYAPNWKHLKEARAAAARQST
jgi:hypothetical protein